MTSDEIFRASKILMQSGEDDLGRKLVELSSELGHLLYELERARKELDCQKSHIRELGKKLDRFLYLERNAYGMAATLPILAIILWMQTDNFMKDLMWYCTLIVLMFEFSTLVTWLERKFSRK